MSLVPLLMLLMAHGLDSRSYTNNFQRRQGAPASYGAPSIPSYNGGGGQPSYNGGQGAKRPKSITIPLPDFDVGQIIREKQNIINSVVNIKKILLSPVLGIGRQIVDTKLSLILPLLAPIIGLKRTGLGFLRGLIDQKIALLDNISSSVGGGGGGGGYGAPPQSYGAPRGWRQRRNFLRR